MIIETQGNIFDSLCDVIVIPVNRFGIMGKGLALEAKHRYPEVFNAYRKKCLDETFHHIACFTAFDGRHVICLATKHHWRNDGSLTLVEDGLKTIVAMMPLSFIKSIAFPKIGCGLGNLEWDKEVYPLLKKYFDNTIYPVEVYV